MPYILEPVNLGKNDVKKVGGKGANLAELINAGFPVPEVFFVSVEAYNKFVEHNDLKSKINDVLKKTDFSDVKSLSNASESIKKLILEGEFPKEIKDAVIAAYRKLYGAPEIDISFIKPLEKPFVSVRSSGVMEDIEGASSAGQYETFLNVKGDDNVIQNIKKCWASLYTSRVIYYRYKHNQPQESSICVIVQRMVNSEKAGVAFTVDPTNPVEGSNHIVIEGCWGLGETLVQGEVEPDRYVVDKENGEILEKHIGEKTLERVRDPTTDVTVKKNVNPERMKEQLLSDYEILALAAYCKKIEQHYGNPQDIEWAFERKKIYILQARAVTTLEDKRTEEVKGTPILEGYGASAAIVTNAGGSTCHAAIVSRELGIPCIVGTKKATEVLKEGMKITVDATHGKVYSGEVEVEQKKEEEVANIKTKTQIKVNLAFPETAEKAKHADGVGLLRLEHMLTKAGMHPIEYVRQGKSDELTKIIFEGVEKVAKAFYPKHVWVRSLDARTDEFRNMQGGENEPKEDNPMLGWHGIRRSLDEPDILKAELRALKQLHENGLDNVVWELPFIINVSELRKAKEIAREIGAPDNFGIMVETPACSLNIEEFCKEGIAFASFGSNDLTQTSLGIDRNNERLIKIFDEMHPGMQFQFRHVIETCNKYDIESSICGELPSNRKDAVEFLVNTGIKSISVNIDAIDKVKEWVSVVEKGGQLK
jgi:pyruvate,water dikinase